MAGLPAGTVTLLFSDIEGSTRLLLRLGAAYPSVLDEHRQLLRTAIGAGGGQVLDTQGDACFAVFTRARDAVQAAAEIQRAMAAHPWPASPGVRVRIGLHTGEPTVTAGGYAGLDVHRAARLCSAGNGGQILVSSTTADLVATLLPPELSLHELGSYRFKDFTFSERVYQLDVQGQPTSFPPLRSLEVTARLPGQHRSMIGRDGDLAACRAVLLEPATRLLTLTGAGGSGKTRLAVAVADGLHDAFDDGICFVPLADVREAGMVATSIAQALGVRDLSTRPTQDTLVDLLGGREQLLILDNMEQVLDAAPLISEVLAACPRLKALVTSREVLHVTGEREFSVPPLALPPESATLPEQIYSLAAPRLFMDRATEAKRDFRATDEDARIIAEICRRLDGLPLAIELAAARVRFLTPSALLSRLDRRLAVLTGGPRDLPARQQTLRAAISWSHDLLDERDRMVFRRVSVFAGGWTLDAAEAVCGLADDPLATIDALASLADKSLLLREELPDGDARFGMLSTIRELAVEHLESSGERDATRRRHADYFLRLAEEAAPHLALDAGQLEWIERLDAESANLQTVFDWTTSAPVDRERAEIGLRLIAALWRFWAVRSGASEARRHIVAVERLVEAAPRSPLRGRALFGAASLARELSDYSTTERLFRECLALAREQHETRQVADTLYSLGWLYVLRGNPGEARALLEESLRLFQRLADAPWKATMLTRLGYVCFMEGEFDRAMALAGEGATLARVLGDQRVLADALVYQGLVQQYTGDLEQARRRFEECLPIARRFGDRHLIAMTLNLTGHLCVHQGLLEDARAYLSEALRIAREVGNVRRLSFTMSAVAALAQAHGDLAFALKIDSAAQAAARSVGTASARPARARSDAELARARAELGEPAASEADAAGRQLTLDQSVDEALRWLADAGPARHDEADLVRWQESPWTVFGWTAPEMTVPGPGVQRAASSAANGGLRAYGEGGVDPSR